jgi:4-carboxymuconolactone decarboxylase
MTMTSSAPAPNLASLDDATRLLVRVSAIVAAGTEAEIREVLADAESGVPHLWIEELLLQTYLFAGFPRALNAMREWRRRVPQSPNGVVLSAAKDPLQKQVVREVYTEERSDERAHDDNAVEWESRGRETCRAVYGRMYDKLRENIQGLHPALDAWMIVEGYGKVLSRPGLDLPRRELCIVAACVASGQDRQLHSHLHGALNVGVPAPVIREALESLTPVVGGERVNAARLLFERVTGK